MHAKAKCIFFVEILLSERIRKSREKRMCVQQLITIASGNDDSGGERATKRRNFNCAHRKTKIWLAIVHDNAKPNQTKQMVLMSFRIFHSNNFLCVFQQFSVIISIGFFLCFICWQNNHFIQKKTKTSFHSIFLLFQSRWLSVYKSLPRQR